VTTLPCYWHPMTERRKKGIALLWMRVSLACSPRSRKHSRTVAAMRNLSIRWRYEIIIAEALATALVTLFTGIAVSARDLGQWDAPNNAELKRWYQDLIQPDNPAASCCGEADA
jgi:hypothetical protein